MIRNLRIAALSISISALALTFVLPYRLIWVPVSLIAVNAVVLPVLMHMERRAARAARG